MSRRSVEGNCRLCGVFGKLSFEHVPPESAFNNRPVYVASFNDFFGHDLDSVRGRQQQRGAGAHTLCESCNSRTGSWYGSSYAEWAEQGVRILRLTRGRASLNYGYRIFPLRVLKQVVCMFFSANNPRFRDGHPELEAFVRDPNRRGLDSRYQLFAFLNAGTRARQAGVSGMIRLDRGATTIMSEITFPPFGFVLCFGSPPPDSRLVDITVFSGYPRNQKREIFLPLPALPVDSYYPGDYRTKSEIEEEAHRQMNAT